MSSKILQARIDEITKSKAEEIFRNLGMSPSDAIRLFYNRVVIENGIPFKMQLPQDNSERKIFDPIEYMESIGEG